jgi:nucleoside-diphosphate-sugar epimerase
MYLLKSSVILVTGGTGFIGSNFIKKMALIGGNVHLIVREESKKDQIDIDILNKINIHKLGKEQDSLIQIMESIKPDIVFHFASLFISEHQPEDITMLIDSNILFGVKLLEAMKLCGATKLVNTGTSWQNFNNSEYSPTNLYAATKQAYEDIIKYYVESGSLQAVTLKLFDTYGVNDERQKLINILKYIAETGECLSMSPGEQLIDLVHVDDVVEAFIIAGSRLLNSEDIRISEYSISSGRPISLKDLVKLISKVSNKKLNIEWGGRPYRDREVMTPWSTGETLPGWSPKLSLEQGICQYYE